MMLAPELFSDRKKASEKNKRTGGSWTKDFDIFILYISTTSAPQAQGEHAITVIQQALPGTSRYSTRPLAVSVAPEVLSVWWGTSVAGVLCRANIAHLQPPKDFQPPVQ